MPHRTLFPSLVLAAVVLARGLLADSPLPVTAAAPPPATTAKDVGVYWAGPESYGRIGSLDGRLIVSNFGNDTPVRLFWARRTGVKLILFNSAWVDDSVTGGRANTALICKNLERVKGSAGLWGYYVVDEPSKHQYPWGGSNPTSVNTMQTVNAAIKRCDPAHSTLAVFLPGGNFGGQGNNFGPNIADVVTFDLYPMAPGSVWHPEWITESPLPQALDVVRSRDRGAAIWMAVQSFGGCGRSGCFRNVTEAQLQSEIDLVQSVFKRKGVRLDGLLFFLWSRSFDDDRSWVTDDMVHHPEFWKYIQYAADRLPPSRLPAGLPEAAVPASQPHEPESAVRIPLQVMWGIVTATTADGSSVRAMGPEFPNPSIALTMGLRTAAVFQQLDGSLPAISVGRIRPFTTALFTGYFLTPGVFKVTKMGVYYLAPPPP